MSEQKATSAQPLDNQMPTPPAGDEAITTMDNQMPTPPAKDGAITTMDNQMPAPPALDLDGDGK
ncbi:MULTISPECIES: hypothetical protein [Streptomyces]|uniref:Sigma-like protein n=3 Tax=Streptomyces rochei group TaxID=2867164 RepID=A0AAX3ZI33_STRRO|nr:MULTISPECIES: hypothetical protein [Streptomyces]MBD2817995.1 hypothetical protein [Streptomyces parvulus]WDI18976.1 hypothetical protein PS783_15945 [Streptomyces enissocaesilis]KYK16029.1 hypothetical protein AUW26_18705 [Streptomyces sp. CC71]MBJ6620061.1 hypothetical protein [Streptomyces sp. DHE17-7]MBQ0879865.1 hypothetical protein [Streptomyces sp. RT42]